MIESTLQSLKVKKIGLSLPRYELAEQEKALLHLFERAKLSEDVALFVSRAQTNHRSSVV